MTVLWSCNNLHQTWKLGTDSMFCSDHTGLCIVQAINPIKCRTNNEAHHATSISPVQLAAGFTRRSAARLPSWRQETLSQSQVSISTSVRILCRQKQMQGRRGEAQTASYSSKDRNLLEPLGISPKWGTLNCTCLREKKIKHTKNPNTTIRHSLS